jgi:UDP-glucose 4-epimerase
VDLVVKSALHVLETSFNETQMLLRTAAKHSTPLLLTSTSEVYGKSAKPEFSEDDDLLIGPPGQSRWSYASAKLTDEFLALAYAREKNLPVTIARLFNTVGPRQTGRYGMVLPRFIASAKKNEPLKVFGDGKQSRCFGFVHDVVEALGRLQSCEKARGEIFNIGGTEEVSMLELAQLVVKTLGSKSKIELIPYDQAYAPGFDDMRRRKPLVAKLERFVKFKPQTPLREIIRLTAG